MDELELIQRTFLVESAERIAELEQLLLAAERGVCDAEAIRTLFRAAHTIKGDAACLGYEALTAFTHTLENVLDGVRAGRLALGVDLAGALLDAVDVLRELLADTAHKRDRLTDAARDVQARLEALAAGPATAAAPCRGPAQEEGPGAAVPARTRAGTLRVDIDRLDRLLDLTGEITIARGRLTSALETRDGARDELLETHREADRLFADLQELVSRLRMVPLGPLFRSFSRVVRDVASTTGKQATLVLEGEEVEVDTSIAEHVRDPLIHLVRNAIDHGLETPEERVRLGKPASGRLTLRASHGAGSITIELSDDGTGLQRERIVERARERGHASPETLSDAELWRLLFEPGFSTAASVTALSGRGVGLDVVRRDIEGLRGQVTVASRAGAGTTMTLRLPLTLALIDGFGVGVGGESYVLPLDAVVECLELPPSERTDRGEGVLNLRGAPLPYVRLRHAFGLAPAADGSRESVVVVRHDGGLAGLAVDALDGGSQAVIKPLGPFFRGLRGVSGSTILSSGKVALILDVAALVRDAAARLAAAGAPAEEAPTDTSLEARPGPEAIP